MSLLTCADNSGAMMFKVINKLGKGQQARQARRGGALRHGDR